MHAFYARQDFGDQWPGHFVDNLSQHRILLGRSTYHGERPDRIVTVEDVFYLHHGKRMREAVVAQVVPKRPFGQEPIGIDRAGDAEIGIGMDRQAIRAPHHSHAATAQYAGKHQFAHPLRQRHHRGQRHCRGAAHEDVHAKRFAGRNSRLVMHADRAMDLIM